MVKAQKFVYVKKFDGKPTPENFRLEEFELADPKEGEILCQAEFLSVDPYMRPYMENYPVGTTMIGEQIAKVIKSQNPKYPVGSYVCGRFGWTSHTLVKPVDDGNNSDSFLRNDKPYLLPDFKGLPLSLGVGALGMPGNTAYFGFLEICKPKAGETVVVTAAAGAVGSFVGQIAKLKGCTVIGFAGSEEKCKYLTEELGFDFAFNYKTDNIDKVLKKAAPKGVDCYFDNVGGEISSTIISNMNLFGRISICGAISSYNSQGVVQAPILQPLFIWKQLKMEGFMVYRWVDRYMEGIVQLRDWIKEGKLKYRETVTDGFKNMPQAFIELLEGKNTGKAVVKA